jgi:hypothetical protein
VSLNPQENEIGVHDGAGRDHLQSSSTSQRKRRPKAGDISNQNTISPMGTYNFFLILILPPLSCRRTDRTRRPPAMIIASKSHIPVTRQTRIEQTIVTCYVCFPFA